MGCIEYLSLPNHNLMPGNGRGGVTNVVLCRLVGTFVPSNVGCHPVGSSCVFALVYSDHAQICLVIFPSLNVLLLPQTL